ncbi:MAG: hypothetical protein IPP48_10525 [Chitinophagaceae bacterium]|nr:hypothetical protein [Chitinophagaceae bacterium]
MQPNTPYLQSNNKWSIIWQETCLPLIQILTNEKIIVLLMSVVLFTGCDVLKSLPQTSGIGGITEAEAGQGIKEALSQGSRRCTSFK